MNKEELLELHKKLSNSKLCKSEYGNPMHIEFRNYLEEVEKLIRGIGE